VILAVVRGDTSGIARAAALLATSGIVAYIRIIMLFWGQPFSQNAEGDYNVAFFLRMCKYNYGVKFYNGNAQVF
jgi:hypothetical protein